MAAIAAVAEDCGLSTGAIYRYFPSKSALFIEVLSSAVAHECEILAEIVDGDGTATQRLRDAVEWFARRARPGRAEERRVGEEGVRPGRSRGWQYPSKKK